MRAAPGAGAAPDSGTAGTVHDPDAPLPWEGIFGEVGDSSTGRHIEQLYCDGVTLGCGDGSNYCPNTAATRAQMAIFPERVMKGASGWPPNTVVVFPIRSTDGTPDATASGTELLTRLASIPGTGSAAPSAPNPWVVLVTAGYYRLGSQTLTLRSWVTLQGPGLDTTLISSTGGGSDLTPAVLTAEHATVRDLSNGANFTTVLASAELRGGATSDAGTLHCAAVWDAGGAF